MDPNGIDLSSHELLNKISDVTRIVDPLQKKVIEYKNNAAIDKDIHCFDFWGKNKVCDNCISIRAYNDNMCSSSKNVSKRSPKRLAPWST